MSLHQAAERLTGTAWVLAFLPLLLLGFVLAYVVVSGGGLKELAGPPLEQLTIQRITLPEPGIIKVEVVNDGPQAVTIPQMLVDEAFWEFTIEPSSTISRLGRAVITIPYPWVTEETHVVKIITKLGMTFEAEIPAAVQSPRPTLSLFLRFGLLGFYVGIVPIFLGMLWYPFMRRMSRQAMNFILSLTVGLLVFLAISTGLDALEFAGKLPTFWQGVPMTAFITVITLLVFLAMATTGSKRSKDEESSPLRIAYLIAFGIGVHNLGEGLAIGSAFTMGEAALGSFLVLGFTLHNITEGVAIAAPIVRKYPGMKHFVLLILLAGAPAIAGVWYGGLSFNPVLATAFMAVGVGAILQVVWEVGKMVARDTKRLEQPLVNWVNLGGLTGGLGLMYFTAFLVKF
jgi:zinc transporter ZupT